MASKTLKEKGGNIKMWMADRSGENKERIKAGKRRRDRVLKIIKFKTIATNTYTNKTNQRNQKLPIC